MTNTLVDMIQASADGNTDLLNEVKKNYNKQLLIVGGTMVAVNLGFKAITKWYWSISRFSIKIR